MKRNLIITLCCICIAIITTSCNGKSNENDKKNSNESKQCEMLTVDQILDQAEAFVDKSIEFEGVCTHRCAHSGLRIFVMGSNDTKTIRVESSDGQPFDTRCARSIVTVKGILKEQRIDEAYLKNWEKQVQEKTEEAHGKGEAGCTSEKKARNEQGNTAQERIDNFRQRISEREKNEGKAYLSFYFVQCEGYTIKDSQN